MSEKSGEAAAIEQAARFLEKKGWQYTHQDIGIMAGEILSEMRRAARGITLLPHVTDYDPFQTKTNEGSK